MAFKRSSSSKELSSSSMPGSFCTIQTSACGKSNGAARRVSPVSLAISLKVLPLRNAAKMSR
eukprot:6861368-Prorocentrum_lima.AAC.1